MDQKEIIEIIRANPELSYEEMKKEALQAGISEQSFNECWGNNKAKESKKILMAISLTIVTTGLILMLIEQNFFYSGTASSLYSSTFMLVFIPMASFYTMLIYGNAIVRILAILIPLIFFPLLILIMSAAA